MTKSQELDALCYILVVSIGLSILSIVDKSEYQKLMNFINREDPKVFSERVLKRK